VNPNTLGFEFSGEEPDSFLVLNQIVPVHTQKNYALTVDYGTSGIPPGSGLAWRVTDEQTGALLAKTTSLSAEPEGRATSCFTTPKDTGFVNLSLEYQRQPGTVRIEGKLALKAVRLAAVAGDCAAEKISNSRGDSPVL
jgi:hypothetical protein